MQAFKSNENRVFPTRIRFTKYQVCQSSIKKLLLFKLLPHAIFNY